MYEQGLNVRWVCRLKAKMKKDRGVAYTWRLVSRVWDLREFGDLDQGKVIRRFGCTAGTDLCFRGKHRSAPAVVAL